MLKKIWISIFTTVASLSLCYAYYNDQIAAVPSNLTYYQPGDLLERSNQDSFVMGGIEWRIVYTDNSTGKGFIMTKNPATSASYQGASYQCQQSRPGSLYIDEIYYDDCLIQAQNYYASADSDTTGKIMESINSVAQVHTVDLDLFNTLVSNDGIASERQHFNQYLAAPGYAWLEEEGSRVHLAYEVNDVTGFGSSRFGNYNYIWDIAQQHSNIGGAAGYSTSLYFSFAVDLPLKGIIKSIKPDHASITKPYSDAMNSAGNLLINIDTVDGEGPYHFYLYDTDSNGVGIDTKPSQYFSLNPDSTNGKAEISLINKLPAGDYYIKVKVVDESVNDRLYYDSADFTKDTFRTKETV